MVSISEILKQTRTAIHIQWIHTPRRVTEEHQHRQLATVLVTKHEKNSSKFATHLTNRGHEIATITAIFKETGSNIKQGPKPNPKPNNDDQDTAPLFFHAQYHPKGPPRKGIREIYNKTLSKNRFNSFTIAFSRPKNLRDKL
jgi:hypothetical protein